MIELRDVTWEVPGFALREVTFTVPTGRYGVLMGRTGSGKTTLVELVCGLREPAAGTVWIGGRDVTWADPADRGLGYVPQDGALFPRLGVEAQIGFGLRMRGIGAGEVRDRVREAAREVGIEGLLARGIAGLSGGERQRVALARALVIRPAVLLLDEPLAAVDEETRAGLVDLLREVQAAHRMTVLHVTHSREEAERLGQVRMRLADGRVRREDEEEVGT
jgi:ABC-type sugar transport system ATPase subunit